MNDDLVRKNGLNKKEMKELSRLVIKEIDQKLNPFEKVQVFPVTPLEFYRTDLFRKAFRFSRGRDKFKVVKSSFYNSGDAYGEKNIIYILCRPCHILKNVREQHQLVDLLMTLYHEYGHIYQKNPMCHMEAYDRFVMLSLEASFIYYFSNDYDKFHDDFLVEMNADLFASHYTFEFLHEYPTIYQEEEGYLNSYLKEIKFRRKNYSFDDFFSKYYELYKKYEVYRNHEKYGDYEVDTSQLVDLDYSFPEVARFFHIFVDDKNGKFRSVMDIYRDFDFNSFNPLLLQGVLSSNAFLNQLRINKLSAEEVKIMVSIITHEYNRECNISEYNDQFIGNQDIDFYLLKKMVDRNKIRVDRLFRVLLKLQIRNIDFGVANSKRK